MNRKMKLLVSFVFISCLSIAGQTFAQTRLAGVSKEDEFVYDRIILWNSTDPSMPTPQFWIELNKTKNLSVVVENVSGQIITADFTFLYENGTTKTTFVSLDVTKGGISSPLFIPTNLATNECFCTTRGQTRINETITKNYLGTTRDTNHIIICGNMTDYYCNSYFEEDYYDKDTGVLVNSNYQWNYHGFDENGNPYNETILNSWNLKGSSVWPIPEFPSFPFTLFLISSILAGVIIYKKKNRKTGN